MLEEIALIVKGLVGNDYLYFPTPVVGEFVGHELYSLWGICVDRDGLVYASDGEDAWHELDEEDSILPLILDRIKIIEKTFVKNSNK